MIYYKMGDKVRYLPLGEIFEDKFSNYINDNIISFDNITNINEKYYYTDLLFGFVCNIFTILEYENEGGRLK